MVAIVALGFAALSGSWLLQRHGPAVPAPVGAPSLEIFRTSVLNVGEDGRAAELERWQRGLAESGTRVGFASAGTTRGTGVRLQSIIDCGACAQGGLPLPVRGVTVSVYAVAPDTFAHLGRSMARGRDFGWDVDRGTASVAIVNRALATDHFEGGVAIGRRLRFGDSDWLTVVGVVSDAPRSFHGDGYEVWLPIGQVVPGRLEVLTDGGTGVDRLVRAAAPAGAEMGEAVTLREVFGVHGWFSAAFGLLAPLTVLLVALGTWAAARSEARAATYEAGVRLALGARRHDVLRFLVGAVARRLALALGLGAWFALFLGAGLHHLPGAVPQFDPTIWLASAIVLTVVVVAASLPAWRRIVRITPTIALEGSE
jgi:putative ABC transport system permease protein